MEQENEYKEVYNNLIKNFYNTNKEIEFTKYFNLRTLTNELYPMNKADISEKVNVSTKTITKWDNTLINKKIISKDGFYYFCLDKDKRVIKQCSKEEYKNFWKNKAIENNIKQLEERYYKGEISIREMLEENSDFTTKVNLISNKYYYRVKKYKTNENNQLYIDTYSLIKTIYGNDPEFKPTFEIIENVQLQDIQFLHTYKFKRLNKSKYINIKLNKVIKIN